MINLVASQTIEERMLSTLNFKTSLFEGVLDNGEDTIFLEDSKFDKMMDSLKVVVEPSEEMDDTHNRMAGSSIDLNDNEEKVVPKPDGLQTTDVDSSVLSEEETPEEGATEVSTERNHSVSSAENNPEQLLQQGFSFLSGLARTLSSPEATQKLVDSIVEEDKETGQVSIRIPVSDKESVAGILNLFGKLLVAGNKS